MAGERIVVVGAGIAGLTAAYFLKQAGHHPIVLEKSGRVGGRMISDIVDGFTIDCGAQFLMERYPLLVDLIHRVGLSSNYIETSQHAGIVRKGKIHKTLRSDKFAPLRTGLLSFPGWFRFGLRGYQLLAKTKSLLPNNYADWQKFDDLDAETWGNLNYGEEVNDYFIEPLMEGLFFQALKDISRAYTNAMTSMFYMQRNKTTALIGGMGVLPERLASGLDVRLNTPVSSMSLSPTGIELNAGGAIIVADRVILATTAPVSRALYLEPAVVERELLATTYSSTLSIAVIVKDSLHLDPYIEEIYGILVPKRERNVISSISNEGLKDKHRLANGKMFILFLAGQAGAEMIDWKDDDVLSVVLAELEKYVPGVSENILFTKIHRWREAMPMSPLGRSRNVARYRESITPSTRIFLVGDYMGMAFTEGASETGRWAAQSLMQYLT